MSFLDGEAASASVIAGEEGVDLDILEGEFINVLFQLHPGMGLFLYIQLLSTSCLLVDYSLLLIFVRRCCW